MSGGPRPDPMADLERLVEDFRASGLRELHARCGDFEVYLSQDTNAAGLDGPKVAVGTAPRSASGRRRRTLFSATAINCSISPTFSRIVVRSASGNSGSIWTRISPLLTACPMRGIALSFGTTRPP